MATIITLDNLELFKELSDDELEEKLSSLQTTIEGDIDTKIGNLNLPIVIDTSLPEAGKDYLNILYLIPSLTTGDNDIYEEYLCVEKNNSYSWEKFGSVSITEITSTTITGSGYGSTVVTGVSASGNTITVTTDTLTASTLGALTGLIKSGTKSDSNNAISDISVSGGTITITYTTLATASDITNAITAAIGTTITADAIGAVPTSRTVNSKALNSDITLTASDVGALAAITKSGTKGANDNVVSDVTLNSSSDGITVSYSQLTASDVGALSEISVGASSSNDADGNAITAIELNTAKDGVLYTKSKLTASDVGAVSSSDLTNYVPITRTVAGHTLSADVTIALTDLSDYSVAEDEDIEALFVEKGE